MRLKYYLRGAGVGILMATIIFAVAIIAGGFNKQNNVNTAKKDEYVPVIDSLVPSETPAKTPEPSKMPEASETVQPSEIPSPSETPSVEATPSEKPVESPSAKPTEAPTAKPTEEPSAKPTVAPSETAKPTAAPSEKPQIVVSVKPTVAPTETVKIVTENVAVSIKLGDDSYKVAKALKAAGLIADAESFNRYLIDQKLEGKIQTGSFYIKGGTSEKEIAQMLVDTKKRTTKLEH